MKGFKDSTKTKSGHGEEHWSVPIARKAMGGIVVPLGGGGPRMGGGMSMGAGRPIMPRPRVMPNIKPVGGGKMMKLAKGGRARLEGNNRQRTGPYSDNEAAHPTPPARPGYKKGGKAKGGLAFNSAPLCGGGRS